MTLSERQQQELVQQLVAEMELVLVFARMAMNRIRRGDTKRSERIIWVARTELRRVRRFENEIADQRIRQQIHDIADGFENVLSNLSAPCVPASHTAPHRTAMFVVSEQATTH